MSLGVRGRPATSDFDADGDVDMNDFNRFRDCATGPSIPYTPASLLGGCTLARDLTGHIPADFDRDVDQDDFGAFQRCYSGPGRPTAPGCAS